MIKLLNDFKESLLKDYFAEKNELIIKDVYFSNDWLILVSENHLCSSLLVFDHEIQSEVFDLSLRFKGKSIFECFSISDGFPDKIKNVLFSSLINLISSYFNTDEMLSKRDIRYITGKSDITSVIDKNSKTLVIGFGGIARNIARTGCELYISDMRPEFELAERLADLREVNPRITYVNNSDQSEYIEKSDFFVITGSILTNNGLKDILENSKKDSYKIMYGPSAAVKPELLFDKGINAILTYRVNNSEEFIRQVIKNTDDVESILKSTQERITYFSE